MSERERGKDHADRKLRLDAVTDEPAIGTDRPAGEFGFEKRLFPSGKVMEARGAGKDDGRLRIELEGRLR